MSHNTVTWPAFWRAVLDQIAADHQDERWSHLCSHSDVELLRLVWRADLEAECIDRHRAWLTLIQTRNELHLVIHGRPSPHGQDPELNYAGYEASAPRAERPLVDLPQAIGTPSFLTPAGTALPVAQTPTPIPLATPPSAQIIPIAPAVSSTTLKLSDLLKINQARKSGHKVEKVYSQPL